MLLAMFKKYYLDSSLVDNMVALYSVVFLCFVTKFIVLIFSTQTDMCKASTEDHLYNFFQR